LAARGVHYLHKPAPTLQDVGFFLLRVCNCHDVLSLSYLEKSSTENGRNAHVTFNLGAVTGAWARQSLHK